MSATHHHEAAMTARTIRLTDDAVRFVRTRTGQHVHVEFVPLAGRTYCGAKVTGQGPEAVAPANLCARCHAEGEAVGA